MDWVLNMVLVLLWLAIGYSAMGFHAAYLRRRFWILYEGDRKSTELLGDYVFSILFMWTGPVAVFLILVLGEFRDGWVHPFSGTMPE